MLKLFLKKLSLLLVLNLLIKPVWVLLIDRKVQLVLGDSEYGMFASLLSFSMWFTIVLDPGIKNYHMTSLSRDKDFFREHFPHFIGFKLFLSLLFMGLLMLAAVIKGNYWQEYAWETCILGLNQIILSFLLFFRATLSGFERYTTDSWFSVSDRLLMMLIVLPAFFTPWLPAMQNMRGFILAHTIAYAASSILVLISLRKELSQLGNFIRFRIPWKVLKQALPFAIFFGLMMLYTKLDFVMLESLLPNGAMKAGIYAKGYRFLEAGNMFALLFGNLLLPVLSSVIHKDSEVRGLIRSGAPLLILPGIILAIACFFVKDGLMADFYPGSADETPMVFGILMLSFVWSCSYYVFSTVLTARQELRILNIYAAIGLVFNLLGNAVLIPRMGVMGAVWSTVGTQGIVAVLQAFKVLSLYRIRPSNRKIILFILFLGLSISTSLILEQYISGWLLRFALIIALNLSFALVFQLIRPGDLLLIINKNSDE